MIKLLIGGSPCTYWSIVQKNNREKTASGIGWELFKNYLIAKEKFKPDFFLYENNKSAAQPIKDQIKKELNVYDGTFFMEDSGSRYIEINSALVSAQNRQRFYVHNCGDVGQPEDRNIMLSDILESGVTDKDKAYCLKHQAGNARDYFKKHHTQVVYEPVIIQNAHGFNKGGVKQGKTPTLTANGKWIYNNPVAIPCGTGKADKARTLTAGYQTSSHRDFVADITSGGQLGHTGVIERVFPLNTTKDGKAQTIKAQYKFTSVQNICCYNSTYGASGVAMPATEQDKEKRKNAKNAIEKVYEVKHGYITIKEKQYEVNLPDGFYVIRKLTVAECCRLQTLNKIIPDDGKKRTREEIEKIKTIAKVVSQTKLPCDEWKNASLREDERDKINSYIVSIRPEWVKKIVNREKTIEVRKSAPKELPFKAYIYCTKDRKNLLPIEHGKVLEKVNFWENTDAYYGFGKVIGEFICGKVDTYCYRSFGYEISEETFNKTMLTGNEFCGYGKGKTLYGWHISDLKIYDKPRELSEFISPSKAKNCVDYCINGICSNLGYEELCGAIRRCEYKKITRPPQSYMYIEEVDE